MKRTRQRLLAALATAMTAWAPAHAQTGLSVTVHVDVPGTLFQKLHEQLDGQTDLDDELDAVGYLTISGTLNSDDGQVLRYRLPNLITVNLSGLTAESHPYIRLNGKTQLTTVTLPDGITVINSSAFENCSALTTVNVPSTVERIESYAFYNTGITSFTVPAGVNYLGDSTFEGCQQLQSFTFPDGLTGEKDLGRNTLYNCPSLTYVKLPSKLKVIPRSTLNACTSLSSVSIPATVTSIGLYAFRACSSLKSSSIPNTVTFIDEGVFMESGLESFAWPSHFSRIPNNTFEGCAALKTVTIPETVDSIGQRAFTNCSSLQQLTIPEGVRVVPGSLCSGATSLTNVTIPSTVYYINSDAFYGCTALTSVDIPDGVTFIGGSAFADCPLTEVKLPSKILEIGRNTFATNTYERIVVPEGCLYIGEGAFANDNLKYLDLPSSVRYVQAPMSYQAVPDSVIFRSAQPPRYGIYSQWYYTSAILFGNNQNANVYVPESSVDIYKAEWNWVPNIKPLTGYDPQTIYVFDYMALDGQTGYQQRKHDYLLARAEGDFPTAGGLTVEAGTTLQAGKYTHEVDYEVEHWWNDRRSHNIASIINRGTMQADEMEYIFRMGGEKQSTFFTPPFDVRVSDITGAYPQTPVLIRRYDGQARANGDFDHTWVDMQPSDVLRAGQGYALYTGYFPVEQPDGGWRFAGDSNPLTLKPLAGGKNCVFANGDVSVPVTHYNGEFAHNQGWNLVGIPYSSYFDLRGIDYDGPVLLTYGTRWTNQMFRAMSPLDDQYVFIPLSAIFVQAPAGMSELTFLEERRQHNSTYVPDAENVNEARALRRADQRRQRVVYDAILLRHSGQEDEELATTRFVINPDATVRYDIGRDAPCVGGDSVPALLYTQAGGVAYAINERPLADGAISLGMQLLGEGTYTLSLTVRGSSTAGGFSADTPVWLHDLKEGTRTLLGTEGYTFHAASGTLADRFVITLGDAQPTAIDATEAATPMRPEGLFNLSGQRVSQQQRGIIIENGKKIIK